MIVPESALDRALWKLKPDDHKLLLPNMVRNILILSLQKVILSILQGNSFCFEENIVDLTVVGL